LEGGFFERKDMTEKENVSLAKRLSLLKTQKKLKNEVEEIEALKTKTNEEKIKQQEEEEQKVFFEQILNNISPIWKTAVETCELEGSNFKINKYTNSLYFQWGEYSERNDAGGPDTIRYFHEILLETRAFKKEFAFNDFKWKEKFENWLIEQLSKELKF